MRIIDYILPFGEYYADIRTKDTIYLHHTAGGHRPDWTIDGWKHDRTKTGDKLAVATAYVIGGISTTNGDASFDGVVYRAFDDKYWAHHLGLKQQNNKRLNQKSIAIEICNYGPLVRTLDGRYINYVKKEVPESMVVTLDEPFRGYKYYHRYTDKQLESLTSLLKDLSLRHNIDIKKGMKELLKVPYRLSYAFDMQDAALKGDPGLWTHSNVRKDKTDCSPQPGLIGLIQSL
jgi:hypothetical protein